MMLFRLESIGRGFYPGFFCTYLCTFVVRILGLDRPAFLRWLFYVSKLRPILRA